MWTFHFWSSWVHKQQLIWVCLPKRLAHFSSLLHTNKYCSKVSTLYSQGGSNEWMINLVICTLDVFLGNEKCDFISKLPDRNIFDLSFIPIILAIQFHLYAVLH